MLVAHKHSVWKVRYELYADGTWVTAWDRSRLSSRGQFDLGAWHYEVHSNWRGSAYELVTGGAVVARSQASRKGITIDAGGLRYELRKPSVWRPDFGLWLHGQPAGMVRPIRQGSADAVADLPGLTLSLEVCVLIAVLTAWSQAVRRPS